MCTEQQKRTVELWECRGCGVNEPCSIEIHSQKSDGNERFVNRQCIGNNRWDVVAWKKILHCPVTHIPNGKAINRSPIYPWMVEA